jgi:hypothetical protein
MKKPPQLRSKAYERRKRLGCDAGYISTFARTESGEGGWRFGQSKMAF